MKFLFALLFLFTLSLPAPAAAGEKAAPATAVEKRSYSMGADLGSKLKQQDIQVDFDQFMSGFTDALAGGPMKLTDEAVKENLADLQREILLKQAERSKRLAEKNKKAGDAFLAENSKKEGIITLPSGLQYKILKQGTGRQPKPTDTVVAHYSGRTINGTEFDSSYQRNKPETFPLGDVISGWQEALQLMKAGAHWQLFIPPDLAYGDQAVGPIEPNSVLIFDVELLEVKESNGEKPAQQ